MATTLNKKQREQIWNKYNHHCAYCGTELEYKEMQVDHLIPQRRATNKAGRGKVPIEQIENFDNYMPSCRRCNHYKRAHNLETFRRYIEEIPKKLLENYICKVGIDYGLVEFHPRKIKFYFEMTDTEKALLNDELPECEVVSLDEIDYAKGFF